MLLSRSIYPIASGRSESTVSDQTEPVEDARIAELTLAGRSSKEIAIQVGLTACDVRYRRRSLGFPSGACRFRNGEPVAKKYLRDSSRRLRTTMLAISQSVGKDSTYEVSRGNAKYFGGKTHHKSGTISPTYYESLMNYLARPRRQAGDALGLRFADPVLDLRRRWIELFCFHPGRGGKKVRDFLKSELRDLPGLRTRVREGLNALRAWMGLTLQRSRRMY